MQVSQSTKAEQFRALHERPGAFVIPNPWDAGTARILTHLGFEALTTTSAGLAFALGRADGAGLVTRDETLANAKAIVDATHLPVAADLENGFGARTRRRSPRRSAWRANWPGWLAGQSRTPRAIPSGRSTTSSRPSSGWRPRSRRPALPFPFVVVGRAENFLHGRPDLDDTIRRLQAFEAVGADVLYAPGLTRADDIRAVCAAVTRPVNALIGLKGAPFSVAELTALGVRRVSVGSALSRAALGAFCAAAREIREYGTLRFAEEALPYAEANRAHGRGSSDRLSSAGCRRPRAGIVPRSALPGRLGGLIIHLPARRPGPCELCPPVDSSRRSGS